MDPIDQMTPDGPIAGAFWWREDVFVQGDLATAWPKMDPDYRLSLVQEWMLSRGIQNPNLADAIAAETPEPSLWEPVATDLLATWRSIWPENVATWGTYGSTAIVELDLEIVYFVDAPEGEYLVGPTASAMPVVMRFRDDRWRVAGLGTYRVTPGWPPTRERITGLS